MLRRLKVRSRLMVVITVPLVLLLAVASPQVLARWERAADADRAADLARAARDVAGVVDAVQRERVVGDGPGDVLTDEAARAAGHPVC